MGRDLIKKATVMANEEMSIGNREVCEWYLQNGTFDDELLKIVQQECFNKRIEPVKVISYQELGNMLNTDGRFNDERLSMRWWWIFDSKYAVISEPLLREILQVLADITNPWTVVAVVQAVTGLSCGFVFLGLPVENNEIISGKELFGYGFLTDTGILTFVGGEEKHVGEIVVGFAIFD